MWWCGQPTDRACGPADWSAGIFHEGHTRVPDTAFSCRFGLANHFQMRVASSTATIDCAGIIASRLPGSVRGF